MSHHWGDMQEAEKQARKQKFAESQRADSNQVPQPEEHNFNTNFLKIDVYFTTRPT